MHMRPARGLFGQRRDGRSFNDECSWCCSCTANLFLKKWSPFLCAHVVAVRLDSDIVFLNSLSLLEAAMMVFMRCASTMARFVSCFSLCTNIFQIICELAHTVVCSIGHGLRAFSNSQLLPKKQQTWFYDSIILLLCCYINFKITNQEIKNGRTSTEAVHDVLHHNG